MPSYRLVLWLLALVGRGGGRLSYESAAVVLPAAGAEYLLLAAGAE